MHTFKYQLKILLKTKELVFWSILFPLILATFFYMAFSNLSSSELYTVSRVAVIEKQENFEFVSLLDELSIVGENQLLEVQYTHLNNAKELLESNEIDGYIVLDQKIELFVLKNGINQTILKTVIDNFYQTTSMINHIYEFNPQISATDIFETLRLEHNYFSDANTNNSDVSVIYFYSLIGMTCLYGGFWGLRVTGMNEANLSRQGTRVTVAPTSKFKVLLSGFVAAFLIQITVMVMLLFYLEIILKISFGRDIGLIALLMLVGSFVGVSLGSVVGNVFKTTENNKITILSSSTMILSFLSGMMIIDIKYFIQNNLPILFYINPVSLVTEALYALYYYPNHCRYYFDLMCLMLIGIILLIISLLEMRVKKYDSL